MTPSKGEPQDDLEKACLRYLGRDPFLQGMRSFVRFGGRLTVKQRQAVLRHLREPYAHKETADASTPAVSEPRGD